MEGRIYPIWEGSGAFHASADPADAMETFCIAIPPPNITGSLHLGHALDNTLQDILIRWKRMQGYNACWIPGTDHAGIGTQVVVERELKKEGLTRHDLGREKFLERVWKWREQYGNRIVEQLKLMGCSCDWSRIRFTLDSGLSRAVREHFVRLHEQGLIYRGTRIVNWCMRCGTALSDLEVRHADHAGSLWYIRYPLKGGGEIVIATTRPETMLGDTAVAVHPEDARYGALVGRTAVLPLLDREIPVIADEYVDRTFGTGALKITPAHDQNDFEIGERHGLETVSILNPDATLNEAAGPYAGMDRFKARDRIVADLESLGLLVKTEPHTSPLGHCARCDTILEPLVSKQWFMRTRELAEDAMRAVEKGEIRLVPDNAPAVFFEWMRNIRDWCISRQIWWGHRIPAWYCAKCGKTIVSRTDPSACECGGALDRDPDTLDTWFSSALWPFSVLGWPDETPDLKKFYPTTVLITGWDIIFFWVARMAMAGIKLTGQVPFRTVVLHSLITDPEGKKMSKSKGNVVDPLDLFDRYGTDAVRFTLCSLETLKQSFRLSDEKVEHGRNFMNKIWNAARFALAELEGHEPPAGPPASLSLADQWILDCTRRRTEWATKALEHFRFDEYANNLLRFFWYEFCDIYIELAKPALQDPAKRAAAQWTLRTVLDASMKLLHPAVPFVTEEIWQRLPRSGGDGKLLMLEPWPRPENYPAGKDAHAGLVQGMIIPLVEAIRVLRYEQGMPARQPAKAAVLTADEAMSHWFKAIRETGYVKTLCWTELEQIADKSKAPRHHVSTVIQGFTVFLELPAPADPAAERGRLAKERDELSRLLDRRTAELSNADYLAKAPPGLVEETRKKAADYEARIARIAERLTQLS